MNNIIYKRIYNHLYQNYYKFTGERNKLVFQNLIRLVEFNSILRKLELSMPINPEYYDIDHIVPISAFSKYSACIFGDYGLSAEDCLLCYRANNLRWLRKEANFNKSNQYTNRQFLKLLRKNNCQKLESVRILINFNCHGTFDTKKNVYIIHNYNGLPEYLKTYINELNSNYLHC